LSIFDIIQNAYLANEKLLAILVDPENHSTKSLIELAEKIEESTAQLVFVGGTLVSKPMEPVINIINQYCHKPIVLFPGSMLQLSANADALLLLSLISGRNPELLIGQQVQAAPYIKRLGLEVIPTGYILVDSGVSTAVEYMSNTKGIPINKPDLIAATALAGEMLGLKTIYLEGGSGASRTISHETIKQIADVLSVPIIVGGGITRPEHLKAAYDAGATVVVAGNVFEQNLDRLLDFSVILKEVNS